MSQDDVETPSAPAPSETAPASALEASAVALPTDPAAWRAVLSAVPPKDLLRVVQQDRFLSARVLTGFRAAPDTLRRPQVLDRLSKELVKLPKIAEAVATLSAATVASDNPEETAPEETASASEAPAPPATETASASRDDKQSHALREAVNRQKTQLREKEAQLHELQAVIAALQKERDQARTETEAVRTALKNAEAETERQKRLREREERKQSAPKPVEKTPNKPVIATVTPPAASGSSEFAEAIADTLTRLLNRARWETVADICREALGQGATGSPLPVTARGRMHSFYAESLYGLGDTAAGEEQDRLAIAALLDTGDATRAAEAVARLLTHITTVKPAYAQLIKRLEPLASHSGKSEAVQEVFRRMSIASPDAYRRLLTALGGGASASSKRNSLIAAPRAADTPALGPDETIVLAPPGENTLSVTPRRIVEAVDAGEEEWVLRLRRVLTALENAKNQDGQRLLEAVVALQPTAAQPFLQRNLRAILVDASNVARHDPDPLAQLVTSRGPAPARVRHLTQMRDFLLQRGYFPVLLIADATLAFVADDADAYRTLVDKHVVYEVPSGTSADEVLLSEARLRGAPIVSNDTFSDWQDAATIERFAFDFSTGRVALHPVK